MPTVYGDNVLQQANYEKSNMYAGTRILSPKKDSLFIQSLDNSRAWFNGTHLSAQGAQKYTAWLADRLVQSGMMRK